MNRIQFIIWAGKQGWKHGQTYLNKAWDLFSKSGNIPKPSQILNKAKDLYKRTTTKPSVIKPEIYTLLIQHDLLKVLKKEPIKAGLLESLKAERKPTVEESTSHYQHEAGI